jgi:hypothetical protein
MDFFAGRNPGQLELFLTRCCYLSVGAVPVWWGAVVFFVKEEGWYFSFLVCCVLPLIGAWLAVRGKREIRAGLSATGALLALGALPLTLVLASLERT